MGGGSSDGWMWWYLVCYCQARSMFITSCRRAEPLLVHMCDRERQNMSCPCDFCFMWATAVQPEGERGPGVSCGPAWGAAFLPPFSAISWLMRMLGAGTEQPVPTSARFPSFLHAQLMDPRASELPLACRV